MTFVCKSYIKFFIISLLATKDTTKLLLQSQIPITPKNFFIEASPVYRSSLAILCADRVRTFGFLINEEELGTNHVEYTIVILSVLTWWLPEIL